MGVTLITWSCGHFVQQTSPKYRTQTEFLAAVRENYWFLSESASHDLANTATETHIAAPEHCPNCQERTSVGIWKNRALEDIAGLRNLAAGCKACYLEMGAQYHHLDFSQKARFAYDKRCATAHAHFWVSNIPRSLDPFFKPIANISQLCDEAERLLNTICEPYEDVRAAFTHINKARAELGRVIAPLKDLLEGVHLMSGAKNKQKMDARSHSGLASRESIISVPKALGWLARMGDWELEAVGALRKALRG